MVVCSEMSRDFIGLVFSPSFGTGKGTSRFLTGIQDGQD
jgi:hypothetical protein